MKSPNPKLASSIAVRLLAALAITWMAARACPGQIPFADSVEAMLLTYKTLPPEDDLLAEVPDWMPDFQLIIVKPWILYRKNAPDEGLAYTLFNTETREAYSCLGIGDKIAFVPTMAFPAVSPPFRALPWKRDTIHGYEVYQLKLFVDGDTIISWCTLELGIDLTGVPGQEGLWLFKETPFEGKKYRTLVSKIAPVKIPAGYIDPERNGALFNWTDKLPRVIPNPWEWQEMPDFLDHRMHELRGRTYPHREAFSLRRKQGSILAMVLVDYQQVNRLPDHVLAWLDGCSREKDVSPVIMTTMPKRDLAVLLEQHPVPASVPHLVIDETLYYKLARKAPFAVILLDQAGVIRFMRNGFFVLDMEETTRAVEALRSTWSQEK